MEIDGKRIRDILQSRIKLVGFDFDGTLALYPNANRPSSWALVDQGLGCSDEVTRLNNRFFNGEFGIVEWSEKTTEIYMRQGATRERIDEIFQKEVKMVKGADKVFGRLKELGIKTTIISGGLMEAYEVYSKTFGIRADYPRIAQRFRFDKSGKLVGGYFTDADFEGKTHALKKVCKEMGITLQECAFIGDERNDIDILSNVRLPIAVNTKIPEVRSVAKLVMDGPDLTPLLSYLDDKKT